MAVAPRRQLGLFDATMIVMGGIIGSGIFMNPYVVALHVHTPFLILGVWLAGGALAMVGAFIWAELAATICICEWPTTPRSRSSTVGCCCW
jgi:APA family basic amino acid/polyamine antiporter